MTHRLLQTAAPTPQGSGESRNYSVRWALVQLASIAFILGTYSIPALKTRAELRSAVLPPIFAGDLSMYLNLANLKTPSRGQILNPYYLVPVPSNGTAYLKFRLGSSLFSVWDKMLGERMWLAMFTWNLFWWGLLCAATIWLFERFLPAYSVTIGLMGLGL